MGFGVILNPKLKGFACVFADRVRSIGFTESWSERFRVEGFRGR